MPGRQYLKIQYFYNNTNNNNNNSLLNRYCNCTKKYVLLQWAESLLRS
jgi:hypothetical protein